MSGIDNPSWKKPPATQSALTGLGVLRAERAPAEWLLYEHEDGRHAVAPSAEAATFAHGNPAWHRVGPVEAPTLRLPAADRELLQKALTALQAATAGLEWYQDHSPDVVNACDDEHAEVMGEAIAALEAALAGTPDELSERECALLDRILEGFADCGETDEGHDVLLDFARRGYLECERYTPTEKAHQALAAWRGGGVDVSGGDAIPHGPTRTP